MKSIFSIFSQRKLAPSWAYQSQAPIWRILLGGDYIAGESRSAEEKKASFFCLNASTGSTIWDRRTLGELWWVGMEAISGDMLLLHEFEKPDLPEHKKIYALDLESGKELWRQEELTFWFTYRDRLYAYRTQFEKRVGYAVNLASGELLQTYEDGLEALFPLRRLAQEEEDQAGLTFPESLAEEPAANAELQERVRNEVGKEPLPGSIEFAQQGSYVVLSYHLPVKKSIPEAPQLENRLVILDSRNGKRLYEETLVRNARAVVPDTFFLKGTRVYFVRDEKTLTAIDLPGQE